MIRQSEEYWIPVKENDKGEYIECDSEKMKQMIEDSKLLISNHDDKVVMRFKIPVGIKSNKKWYQFWKKNIDTQIHKDTIGEMMALYKKDFELDETTGEVKINDNKELKINKDFLL
ncbi:hypothetical protein M0Q50_04490 [bacterium]|jgi:protein tyrosine phosphatase|nr:hypothetical protein [bacterium]